MKMEDFTAMETGSGERPMWLMKCPTLVASHMQQPLPSLAKVTLSVDPLSTEDDETKFVMELAQAETGKNNPKRYALDMTNDFTPMSVFSESSDGTMSAEGKIKHKFDMRPHNQSIESYGQLCRERATKHSKNRQIKVIDDTNQTRMTPLPGMINPTGTDEKKRAGNKAPEMRRTRRDRGEMEEIMFSLFERQSNWTLKQLFQATDQPERYLTELLRDLCIYNNKGKNQGTYELKPEYKKASRD